MDSSLAARVERRRRRFDWAGGGQRSGFTLMELLLVVAILGILVTLLLPTLTRAKATTRRVICSSNVRQVDVAMHMYLQDYSDYYPAAKDPVSVSPFYWLWMGRGWRSMVASYFRSVVDKDHPSILVCPADPAEKNLYESTSYAYSMSFYHSPQQIDAINSVALTYTNPAPPVRQSTQDVERPSGKILIGEWTSNHEPVTKENGWWNWQGARNFLLADGSVEFIKTTDILPARDNLPDPNLTIHGIRGVDVAK